MGTPELSSAANLELMPQEAGGAISREILKTLFRIRRSPGPHAACGLSCPSCEGPHLAKIAKAIRAGKPITFVLPAFPGKSPNLAKVLGPLPDMAEQLALRHLQNLCDQIQETYSAGARIILCSDGRVFSDAVGMRETDVTEYQKELSRMISELGLKHISTFNLDDVYETNEFAKMRETLMENFSVPLEVLREKVLRGSQPLAPREEVEANRMYCGITRFLVEDASFPGQVKSRSAIQKECRAKAYEVIRRSNAWSELIARRFPEAVRLSIHPQGCGSQKLGVRLVGTESWMTPWHGVAVKTNETFMLLKRSEAEALGAQLVHGPNGRPSHFELRKTIHPVL